MTSYKYSILSILLLLLAGIVSAGAPNITTYSPTSNPTDQIGMGGGFSIISNQSGAIKWYLNGTLKQYSYGTESTYINSSSKYQASAYNVTVVVTNSNGVSTHMWNWTVTNLSVLGIISYSPSSDHTDVNGTARTFSIVSNQTISHVYWLINGTLVQTSAGGEYTASYTNSTAPAKVFWNVTAIVNNSNGNASHTWNWTVTTRDQPSITGYAPLSNPTDLNTSSRTFNITVNQTGTIKWYINGSLKQTDTATTVSSYTNSTAPTGTYNVSVNFTGANNTASRQWIWVRTTAPTIISYAPALTLTDTNATISRTFNVTADRTSNYTWYVDGVLTQINTSTLTIANYTNSTPSLGVHNVSAIVNNTNGTGNMITWSWNVPASTMSGATLVTNHSTAGRAIKGTNSSLNFSWNDTGNITYANFTFPAGFNFTSLISANISSNLGTMTVTANQGTGVVSLYNATGLNNSAIYVNFTVNVTTPATSGDYAVILRTNKNTAGTNTTVYSRNTSRPYFVVANNSVFTVGAETFSAFTTVIPLTGKGVSNLTIYAPNITGQTNITVGYGATNASYITTNYTGGINVIYVVTDGTVTNPIITITNVSGMQSSNLPYIVVTGGAIIMAAGYYVLRRRRH